MGFSAVARRQWLGYTCLKRVYPTATSDTAGRSSLRVAVVFGVLFLILLGVVFLFFVVFF